MPPKKLPFSMLEILPDQTKSLEDNLSRGLQRLAFFLGSHPNGQYVLKAGDTPITRAEDIPANPELLCVEARDELALVEMGSVLARRDANTNSRVGILRGLSAAAIPNVLSSRQRNSKSLKEMVADIFAKHELSEVAPQAVTGEDAIVDELLETQQQQQECKGRENEVFHPAVAARLRRVAQVAKRHGLRINKAFHEAVLRNGRVDFLFTKENEQTYYAGNALFFLEVKQTNTPAKSEEVLLREGVQQVVSRIINRQDHLLARFGLGLVCNGERLLCVRVDLQKGNVPIFVSRAVDLDSAEGLRLLVRFLCNTSSDEFGLPNRDVFELQGLQYVRALGSGGFADAAVVLDDNKEECVCKMVRDTSNKEILEAEAKALQKLAGIDGVPTLVRAEADKLFTKPVGVPLAQHMRTMSEVQRKFFAGRVLADIKTLLAAVHTRGMIHGDIRPDNLVMVDGKLFLLDWGSAIDKKQLRGDNPFMSDELLRGGPPSPEDDHKALLFTYLTIQDNPNGQAPWPYEFQLNSAGAINDRTLWLQSYADAHPDLDLSLILKTRAKKS